MSHRLESMNKINWDHAFLLIMFDSKCLSLSCVKKRTAHVDYIWKARLTLRLSQSRNQETLFLHKQVKFIELL